jgi:hypothetical protein
LKRVTQGRTGIAQLVRRHMRWRVGLRWIALGVGAFGLLLMIALAYTLLNRELNPRLVRRRTPLVVVIFVAYLLQRRFAFRLLGQPVGSTGLDSIYELAYVLLAVCTVGMWRAYGLLGAKRTGLREWRRPSHYTDDKVPPRQGRGVDERARSQPW